MLARCLMIHTWIKSWPLPETMLFYQTEFKPHDDVIKWKHFSCYWPLCREFIGNRWIPLPKASDTELWCFLWSARWINGWVNNRQSGYLRSNRAHFDVIVMLRNELGWNSNEMTFVTGKVFWFIVSKYRAFDSGIRVLTYPPPLDISQTTISKAFLEWKVLYFDSNFTEVCS